MASLIARRAFTTTARRLATGEEALKTESKKNPEIMVRQIPTTTPSRPPRQQLFSWEQLRLSGYNLGLFVGEGLWLTGLLNAL
jgi:hypothetical protein